ncbi:S8 family peptidase [Pseudoneobacillus sp. C159]
MKKWHRMTLSVGLASSLLVPSFSQAAVKEQTTTVKNKLTYDQKLANNQKDVLSSDTLVIKYQSKLPANLHRQSGVKLERSIPSLGYDIVKLSKGQKMSDVVKFYTQQPKVTSVSPSVTYQTTSIASDPKATQMYHLELLSIDKAQRLAGNNAVTVAVIDTGMDIKHPELKGRVLPPYSVMNPSRQPITSDHGTHVAGIIAAEKGNGVGGYGINPNAKILPIDVFSGGYYTSDYTIAEGILYAISKNVKVINMSLSGPMESPILAEAVQKAVDAGITIVAAAGNSYGESVEYPAAYEGVIAVSSTNWENKLSKFSSYGANIDLAAPGEAIYSSIYYPQKGSTFAEASGTSMASPAVAGVVSLLLSKHPDLKPIEIEAILKMTAKDLGDLGYDIKYGAGLVDPVKAMNFDLKNLPKFDVKNDKEKAEELTGDKKEWNGRFASAGETHWYKVKLAKGEGTQALLDGAKNFNYKMIFDFVPDAADGKKESYQINDAKQGKREGGFFQAKEPGTLFVGVKDVYGNYDRASIYTLSLTKEKEMKIDNVTATEPIVITELPFNSGTAVKDTLTFAVDAEAKEADKDYFRFTVTEPTTVKFDLSAVPGIDSSIAVYFEQDFFMTPPPDLPPGYYWEKPMIQYANVNGVSEGEKVSFEAIPEMTYLIEVSAEPKRDFWFEMMMGGAPNTDKPVPNSNTPYTLKAEKVVPEPDEDGFPERGPRPEDSVTKGEMAPAAYQELKRREFKSAMEKAADMPYYRYMDANMVNIVKEKALPYTLGGKLEGKIQFGGDEDFYKFTAEADTIYEFELAKPNGLEFLPVVQILSYDAKNNDLVPISYIWTYGLMWGETVDLTRSIALEKDKEYYIRIMNDRYQASDEAYVVTSQKLMDVPETQDFDLNNESRATVLAPGQKAKNHLIYSTDTDYYYYKNRGDEDKFLSLTVQPQAFSPEEWEKLPEQLRNPLLAFATIIEDTNGNMKIDPEEAGKVTGAEPNQYTLNTEASFRAKKGVGYFFVLNGYTMDGDVSVQPYEIGLHNWNVKDEDAGSVVKGNIPSAPLKMKEIKDGGAVVGYEASGYFNPGIDFGDKDYYSLKLDKYSKFLAVLETPMHLDGVLTVYDAKGKKMARFDNYGMGDFEIGTLTLPKGQYYIVVEEAGGMTSLEGYALTLVKQ